MTVSGTLYSNDLTAASVNIAGDAVIAGNLTVQGTTTTINSTTIAVADKNIVLAKDAATAAAADGAGITVNGPATSATILYDYITDRWVFNKDITVSNLYGNIASIDGGTY